MRSILIISFLTICLFVNGQEETVVKSRSGGTDDAHVAEMIADSLANHPSGGGTVRSVATTSPLLGGPITTTGTLYIDTGYHIKAVVPWAIHQKDSILAASKATNQAVHDSIINNFTHVTVEFDSINIVRRDTMLVISGSSNKIIRLISAGCRYFKVGTLYYSSSSSQYIEGYGTTKNLASYQGATLNTIITLTSNQIGYFNGPTVACPIGSNYYIGLNGTITGGNGKLLFDIYYTYITIH